MRVLTVVSATDQRDLSTYVAVDFASDDQPERCEWCPAWRFDWVDTPEGNTVLREWHLPSCGVAIEWAEITE